MEQHTPEAATTENGSSPPPQQSHSDVRAVDVNSSASLPDELESKSNGSTSENFENVEEVVPAPFCIPDPIIRRAEVDGVVGELRAHDVRWHFRTDDNKSWKPFSGRDSLLIELRWRQCARIPFDPETLAAVGEGRLKQKDIVVLNGLYKLEIENECVQPLYWEGSPRPIVRGTWFREDNAEPLEPWLSEPIEKEHLRVFSGHSIPDKPVYFDQKMKKKPILTSLKLSGIEIDWNSVIETKMFKPGTFLRGSGCKLYRGFGPKASLVDDPKPVDHLVFVVHGIGHRDESNKIVESTDRIREIADEQFNKAFNDSATRPLLLPVAWRAGLKLDDGLTESLTVPYVPAIRSVLQLTAMDVMYYNSPIYRDEICMGVATTMNELYWKFIENNPDFLERKGRVSIFAHSLGSLISYDIITGYCPVNVKQELASFLDKTRARSPDLIHQIDDLKNKVDQQLGEDSFSKLFQENKPRFEFAVENLLCVGSALSVFLALRGKTGIDVIPKESPKRIYNVFHCTDPVGFRFEPLIDRRYSFIRPVTVESHTVASKAIPYDQVKTEIHERLVKEEWKQVNHVVTPDILDDKDFDAAIDSDMHAADEKADELQQSPASSPEMPRKDSEVHPTKRGFSWPWHRGKNSQPALVNGSDEARKTSATASKWPPLDADALLSEIPPDQRLEKRVDFMLKKATTEVGYLSALRSHFTYWSNKDVVFFLLQVLYPPVSAEEASASK